MPENTKVNVNIPN